MTDTLMNILQWLVPSGGLGAVMVWITSRKLRTIRVAKEEHDTYKLMYEDVSKTLLEIRTDYERLQKAINKLERAISKAHGCTYRDICPILRTELSDDSVTKRNRAVRKQPARQPLIRDPADKHSGSAGGESEPGDPKVQPS